MPLIDQNSSALSDLFATGQSTSNLCVPTSAAMALSAITLDGLSYYVGSWTQKQIVNHSLTDRVRAFASLMGTTASGGTSSVNAGLYADRSADLVKATSSKVTASDALIGDNLIKSYVDRQQVNILTYGHYTENCVSSLGGSLYSCAYNRNGGHEIAVNGSLVEDGLRKTRFNDPWYAQVKNYNLVSVPSKSYLSLPVIGKLDIDSRPYGGNTAAVFVSGSSVKIIDRTDGINTND